MRLTIVYAEAGRSWCGEVELFSETRVRDAIKRAELETNCSGRDLLSNKFYAVWNKAVETDHLLKDGDRLEVLRELQIDPMSRRRREATASLKRSSV